MDIQIEYGVLQSVQIINISYPVVKIKQFEFGKKSVKTIKISFPGVKININ